MVNHFVVKEGNENIGQEIIDFIIESSLIRAEEKGLMVWSANADEQLTAFIKEKYDDR